MKILIEESVLRQALEALSNCEGMLPEYHQWLSDAQIALRTALDAAEKVEPVAWHGVTGDYGFRFLSFQEQPGMTPLYTAPTPPTNDAKLGADKTGEK